MEIRVRRMKKKDAADVALLSAQLGYPLSEKQILKNIKAVRKNKEHDAFVAKDNKKITGWIGVAKIIMIESAPYCEINGLVVDEDYRGKGIGKILIEKAKQWGREKALATMRVRCNVKRTETHSFYTHLGFTEIKEQKNFEIKIFS